MIWETGRDPESGLFVSCPHCPKIQGNTPCHLPSFHSAIPKDSYVFFVLCVLATCPTHCSFLDYTSPIILWK